MGRQTANSGRFESAQKVGRRRLIVKRILVVFLTFLLIATGTAFGYVKYIEGKMHPKGKLAGAIAAVLSRPQPKEPVNFLIIGADAIPDEDAGRSDTLIVLHVDRNANKGTMISIPRDFRVTIPGQGKDKINHAFNYGGTPLTIKTIEEYTGLPIHHYVVINYEGFQEMVDTVGGVNVTVDKYMEDEELAGGPLEEGPQQLNGIQALFFVRWRNDPKGDFTRIEHQQVFFRALIDESTRITNSFRLPQLANAVANHVETDMSVSEMLDFAGQIKSVTQEKLVTVTLPGTSDTIDGVSYVIPDQEKVDMVMELIRNNKPVDPALLEVVEPSEVNVKVLNGSATEGVGGEVGDILGNEGFQIVEVGNADKSDYATSILFYRKADYAKALKVKSTLKDHLPNIQLTESSTLDPQAHVLLIVGRDYTQ